MYAKSWKWCVQCTQKAEFGLNTSQTKHEANDRGRHAILRKESANISLNRADDKRCFWNVPFIFSISLVRISEFLYANFSFTCVHGVRISSKASATAVSNAKLCLNIQYLLFPLMNEFFECQPIKAFLLSRSTTHGTSYWLGSHAERLPRPPHGLTHQFSSPALLRRAYVFPPRTAPADDTRGRSLSDTTVPRLRTEETHTRCSLPSRIMPLPGRRLTSPELRSSHPTPLSCVGAMIDLG